MCISTQHKIVNILSKTVKLAHFSQYIIHITSIASQQMKNYKYSPYLYPSLITYYQHNSLPAIWGEN